MKLSITILFVCISFVSFSQTWQWAQAYGGNSFDFGSDVVTDYEGNVYFTGIVSDSAFFLTDTISNQASFVAKFDSLGNEIWVKPILHGVYNRPKIQVDQNNFIYFYTTLNLVDTNVIDQDTLLRSEGVIAIIKLNTDGDVIWSKNFITNSNGGTLGIRQNELAVGSNGNIYLTGSFVDTAYFSSATLYPANGCAFVLNLDSDGNEIWVRQFGAISFSGSMNLIESIAVDDVNSIYIAGRLQYSGVFGPDTLTAQTNWVDLYIAKFNSVGDYLWVIQEGGITPGPGAGAGATIIPSSIAYDNNGAIICGGLYNQDCVVGDSLLLNPLSIFQHACFISKYDTNGNFIRAKKNLKSAITSMECDINGNIIVGGQFSDSVELGIVFYSSFATVANGFVAKYDSILEIDWATITDSRTSNIYISNAKCNSNRIYATDNYSNSIGSFGGINLPIPNSSDLFFACVSNPNNPNNACYFTGLSERSYITTELLVYPNPSNTSINFKIDGNFINQISLYDVSGRLVLSSNCDGVSEHNLSVDDLTPGIYFYEVQCDGSQNHSGKIVVN